MAKLPKSRHFATFDAKNRKLPQGFKRKRACHLIGSVLVFTFKKVRLCANAPFLSYDGSKFVEFRGGSTPRGADVHHDVERRKSIYPSSSTPGVRRKCQKPMSTWDLSKVSHFPKGTKNGTHILEGVGNIIRQQKDHVASILVEIFDKNCRKPEMHRFRPNLTF